MNMHDLCVIGAGAAGSIAAIRAAELGKKVIIIERNDSIGKKILITGKGRCNVTNTAPIESFVEKFGENGQFFRSAFYNFPPDDLIEFFKKNGLEMKVERQGRVFPVTDKSRSVVESLLKILSDNKVDVTYNTRIMEIKKHGDHFNIAAEDGRKFCAQKVIIATGGVSYKATGSTGDGLSFAKKLGHKIIEHIPGLVPLTVKEQWIKELQGIALENIKITFQQGRKKLVSGVGELMFTHFGVSGPLVLDMSFDVMKLLGRNEEVRLLIDLKPGLRYEQLESKLLYKFKTKGSTAMKNIMKDILPQRLIERFLKNAGVLGDIKTNQLKQNERKAIIELLKAFPLTISGSLPVEEAMVTGGGVSVREIDPRTMESKVTPGIFFAGEIIEGSAASGGYNLQQAFSTGYLAGESAAK